MTARTHGIPRSSVAAYNNHRNRMLAYGQWEPYVDAGPARLHVRWLFTQGLTWGQVLALSGITNGSLHRLMAGGPGTRPPSRRVRPETAAAILAVHPSPGLLLSLLPDSAWVDGTGTRRRIQGLAYAGWPLRRQAEMSGIPELIAVLYGDGKVRAVTARAVRALARELRDKTPAEGPGHPVGQARANARKRRWVPVAAWDAIDDPDARPVPGWERDEGIRRYRVLAEEAVELHGQREHPEMIARRLGVKTETVERTLQRARRQSSRSAA